MTLPRQLIVARTECGRVFMEAVTAPAVLARQLEAEGYTLDSVAPLMDAGPAVAEDPGGVVGLRMRIDRVMSEDGTTRQFAMTLFLSPALCRGLGLVNRPHGEDVPIVLGKLAEGVLSIRPVFVSDVAVTMRANGGAFIVLPWLRHKDDAWAACPNGARVEYDAEIREVTRGQVHFVAANKKEGA